MRYPRGRANIHCVKKPLMILVGVSLVASACIETSSYDGIASTSTSIVGLPPTTTVGEESTTTSAVATTVVAPRTLDPNFSMLFSARVDEEFVHDQGAFTQGLAFRDGLFYESTGQYGESSVRIVEPRTGEVLAQADLPDEFFGEGLEIVGDRLVQLTWTSEIALIWDAYTLAPLGSYSYEGEGWGLCERENEFVMSNGSSQLTVRDIDTFEPIRTIDVRLRGEPVELLNELECTASWVYANIWKSHDIVVIDPESGFVIATIITDQVFVELDDWPGIDGINGIAYDALTDSYFLTGKYWRQVFQVHLAHIGYPCVLPASSDSLPACPTLE